MDVDPSSLVNDEVMEPTIDLHVAVPQIATATPLDVYALWVFTCPTLSLPLPPASTLAEHTINHSTATWGVPDVCPRQVK